MKVYWDIPEEFTKDYTDGSKEFAFPLLNDIDLTGSSPFISLLYEKISCKNNKIEEEETNYNGPIIVAEENENCKITSWYQNGLIKVKPNIPLKEFKGTPTKTFNKMVGGFNILIRFKSLLMSMSIINTISTLLMLGFIFTGFYGTGLILALVIIFIGALQYFALTLYYNQFIIKKGAKLFKVVSDKEITFYPRSEIINN